MANNEQTFNLLKEEVRILQNIDFPLTQPSPNTEKNKTIEEGELDIKTDDGPPPPPGSGGPPPPPGSGGPPPPPG